MGFLGYKAAERSLCPIYSYTRNPAIILQNIARMKFYHFEEGGKKQQAGFLISNLHPTFPAW